MRLTFAVILLLVAAHTFAQQQAVDGSILLPDGTRHKGKLIYDVRTSLVSFESNGVWRKYNAQTLAGFEFNNKKREFYSIPHRSSQGGVVKQFFEVVREYKDFAVVSKTNMLSQNTSSEVTIFYFVLASDRSVMPYLEVLDREVKWQIFDANRTQVRILDNDLPETIMGDNFDKVKAFAKERKLVWHVKDSLLSILDYYDSLLVP